MKIPRMFAALRSPALSALLLAVLVMAVAGSALAANNLASNGSFETDTNSDGVPNNWLTYQLTPADKRVCNQAYAGACSFKLVADGTEKFIQQDLGLSGSSGEQYKLSIWMKGKDIVNGSGNLVAAVLWFPSGTEEILFPDGTNAWSGSQIIVTAPSDFSAVIIRLYSTADSGKAWLDKVKFVPYVP